KEANKLTHSFHHLQVQKDLLQHENEGLREVLSTKKKHKKKGKVLDLQQRQEYHSSAVVWSPRKFREARIRQDIKEKEAEESQIQKAQTKEIKAAAQLYKLQIAEQKRVAREAAKENRERMKAEKAAQTAEHARIKQAQNEAQNTEKALQLSQKGKRKASSKPSTQKRRKVAREVVEVEEPAPAPPPRTSRRGRNINLPKKFK
ncbi:hypothetical protein EJ02DRAFT_355103, partial [Clathrospora elynae]